MCPASWPAVLQPSCYAVKPTSLNTPTALASPSCAQERPRALPPRHSDPLTRHLGFSAARVLAFKENNKNN